MTHGTRSVLAGFLILLSGVAFGQDRSGPASRTVRISGRIVDPSGAPVPNLPVNFQALQAAGPPETVRTNQDGSFRFAAQGGAPYTMHLTVPASTFGGLGTIAAVEGLSVDMGNIVLRPSSGPAPAAPLVGIIRITQSPAAASSIAALYVDCSDVRPEHCERGTVHIIHGDGKELVPPKEKDQVGGRLPMISEDRQAVGWLAASDFCCTSYPITPKLVVYRPGKPLRQFEGDGRAIFDWRFAAEGKQVAFYQDFLHGAPGPHYELRDIETGRLIDKWDGPLTPQSPAWTRGLRSS